MPLTFLNSPQSDPRVLHPSSSTILPRVASTQTLGLVHLQLSLDYSPTSGRLRDRESWNRGTGEPGTSVAVMSIASLTFLLIAITGVVIITNAPNLASSLVAIAAIPLQF
ncbi:hypothetical protein BJ912DRAFT_1060623 [Pholiota molesta]|nr:hypothetical protein BJ912DRAFT_1060623 [Pholiota molesta]